MKMNNKSYIKQNSNQIDSQNRFYSQRQQKPYFNQEENFQDELKAIANDIINHQKQEQETLHEIQSLKNDLKQFKTSISQAKQNPELINCLQHVKESNLQFIQDQNMAKLLQLQYQNPQMTESSLKSLVSHNPTTTVEELQEFLDS